ncbi:alpha/beta hydrolase [Gordonia insulae]|uniref:Haloalkane dehalogenase n=1 Tax=Gordonia insulae TaxID=2420509 RepID=A0A3G8JPA6_9ACTN|nr:Haloalkane dehalogenase [Gordonia insulae]
MGDDTVTHRPPGRLVDVDNSSLHVLDDGDGPPLLLLAALGSNWFDLDPLTDRLRASWRVIRYDRPGYGLSEPIGPLAHPTLDGEVDRICAVLDAVGIDGPVTVVAHSMASIYAEAFARRCPERTAGVVMIDGSFVMVPWRMLPTRGRTFIARRLDSVVEMLSRGLGLRRRSADLRPRLLPAPPEGFDGTQQYWATTVFGQRPMVRATLIEHAAFPALNADLRSLRRRRPMPGVPRVVVGAVHGVRPWRHYWAWKQTRYAQMLGASRVLIAGQHFLVLDRPDELAEAIDAIRPGSAGAGQ